MLNADGHNYTYDYPFDGIDWLITKVILMVMMVILMLVVILKLPKIIICLAPP